MAASNPQKPAGIMPDPLDMREIIFTNFLLVGFDPGTMEAKHRIPFNRDMFALPNKKAMEVVMQFLFSRLDPQCAFDEFRNCWPVRDKTKEQQFRKVCYEWVSRIVKEDPNACLPRIVQSLFHSPGGDRFYTFLFHFSSYVLQKVMQRDHSKDVVIPPTPRKTLHNQSLSRVMSKALRAHCAVQRKRFLEHVHYAVELQKQWQDFALETTKENRCLMKKKRDLDRKVKTLAGPKTDYQEEIEALQRTECLQKVRNLWRGLDEICTVQRPQREVVNTVLRRESNKYRIDAANMQIQVPDILLREREEEIQQRNIENTYVGGKVNLLSLMQLWNISLSLLKEKIQKDPIPEFEHHMPTVTSAMHTHQAHLSNTKAMRTSLQQEVLPDLRENVERLKVQLYSELEQQQQQRTPQQVAPFNLGLGLVPPTPPMSFDAADTPVSQRFASLHETLRKSPESVSTPEVVQAWSKSLRTGQTSDEHGPSTQARPHRTHAESSKELRMSDAAPSRLPRPVEKASLKEPTTRKQLSQQKLQTLKSSKTTGVHSASRPKTRASSLSKETPRARTGAAGIAKTKSRKVGQSKTVPRNDDGERVSWVQEMLEDKVVSAVSRDHALSGSRRSSQSSSTPSTSKETVLEDPLGNLDASVAFVSRDLITRTPRAEEQNGVMSPASSSANKTLQASSGFSTGRASLLETILQQSEQRPTPQQVHSELMDDSSDSGTDSPFSRMLATRTPVPAAARGEVTSALHTPVQDEDAPFSTPLGHLSWHSSLTERSGSSMTHGGIGHTPVGDQPGEGSPASRHALTPAATVLSSDKRSHISVDALLDFDFQSPLFEPREPDVTVGSPSHALFEDEPNQGDTPAGHAHHPQLGDLFPSRKEYGELSFLPVSAGINSSFTNENLVSPPTLDTESVPSEARRKDEGNSPRVAPVTAETSEICGEKDAALPPTEPELMSTGNLSPAAPVAAETSEFCGENDAALPPSEPEVISTVPADRNEPILPTDLLKRLQKIKQANQNGQVFVANSSAVGSSALAPSRLGQTWAGSLDTAQLASRLQEIRGAQREQIPNGRTTSSSNDVIASLTRLSLDLHQTPHQMPSVRPQSNGQSSPGSGLSESYLCHSPSKPSDAEDVRTPNPPEPIFTLGDFGEAEGGEFSNEHFSSIARMHHEVRSAGRHGSSLRKSAKKSLEESFSSARKSLGFSRSFGTPNPEGFWLTNEKRLSFGDLLEDSPAHFRNLSHSDTTPAGREGTAVQSTSPAVGQLIDFG